MGTYHRLCHFVARGMFSAHVRSLFIRLIVVAGTVVAGFSPVAISAAQTTANLQQQPVIVHFFEREDCGFCAAERAFLREYIAEHPQVQVIPHDVVADPASKLIFSDITASTGLPKVTPLTVIGSTVIQGFDSAATPGQIERAIAQAQPDDLPRYIANDSLTVLPSVGGTCDEESVGSDAGICSIAATQIQTVSVPFIGAVNVSAFSLGSLSAILGFVDGFNPCAMWVLVTFLILLSQIKSRRRMVQAAGLFIIAEAITYNLILNLWYTAWDFVALDRIVTPAVGALALGSGAWFLWRWWKSRQQSALVCEITDNDPKLIARMERLINSPFTLMTALGIIGVALSVNIIEFACSIGIPQAYTKVLELNDLSALARQGYLSIYTFMYMIDDLIVFGLALWGFKHLHATGAKYSRLSLLVGGLGLLILGALLVFAPEMLVLAA